MAIIGSTNIYPPVISTFSPAFVVQKTECRVYFSFSAYNSVEYIKGNCDIHVSVRRQDNGLCALDLSKYPSELKIMRASDIHTDTERTSADKYYIIIPSDDIQDGFQAGLYYKVQMRFSDNKYSNLTPPQQLNSYLSNNLAHFSEWSQIALVSGIFEPEITISGGVNGTLSTVSNTWYSDTLDVVGSCTIPEQVDSLRDYQLILYDTKENIIEDTGILYPPYQSDANQINYTFKRQLIDGENYILTINYTTENLYKGTISYPINILINSIEQLDAYVEADEDEENGRIGILIKTNSITPFAGRITIRRTSSLSDFQLWEDVHTVGLRLDKLQYTWYDYTIESGVWYKYCIQKRNANGDRGIITMLNKTVMIRFDHIYLDAEGKQIKVKFNPNISSFQRIIKEQKIETIGNQYPVIKRNANTNYRCFPLSGTITALMDGDEISEISGNGMFNSLMVKPTAVSTKESPHIFTSREQLYKEDILELYDDYNDENRIDKYNDTQYERDFRDLIIDFLYKHNVKLFRSATEGNILVKLTDISFSPKNELGRRIYDFSCTCNEIDDFNLINCDEYNIQVIDIGDTDEILSYEIGYEGQWMNTIPAGAEFVHLDPLSGEYSILEKYYNKMQQEKYVLSVPYLNFLRIEMQDPPYLIYDQDGTPVPYEENVPGKSSATAAAAYLGYIAYINNQPIVIPEDGIYEIKNEDAQISSLQFEKDTNAEIRYYATTSQTEDTSQMLSLTSYDEFLGQEWGTFLPGESLYDKLWNKYHQDHQGNEDADNYYQALVGIYGIRIEADPNTIAWVKEEGENVMDRHIIGPTASLDFYDNDSVIADVYFSGLHFEEVTDAEAARDELPENKYYLDDDVEYEFLDLIDNPKNHHVYKINPNIPSAGSGSDNYTYDALNDVPKLASLMTAKGVPAFYLRDHENEIMILGEDDVEELQSYLEGFGYIVYKTPDIYPSEIIAIKQAEKVSSTTAGDMEFEYVLDSVENRKKLAAFKIIIESGAYGSDITLAIKEQIWNRLQYPEAGYYIYHNNNWYVFDLDKGDMVSPVPVMIDYLCETMRGYYRT